MTEPPLPSPWAPAYRRLWLPEVLAVAAVMVGSLAIFWTTSLDMDISRAAYHVPGHAGAWPYAAHPFWHTLNKGHVDAALTAILALGSVGVLVAGAWHAPSRRRRRYAALVLLSVLLGPGLVVNGIFKANWGRPRPRMIAEFGGQYAYAPPLLKQDRTLGKSFPSGHASIAFEYAVFWFVWRRRVRRGVPALVAGLGMGTVMGAARVLAGAHYASDIVWAFCFTFLVSSILYHFVLKIPIHEDRLRVAD